jgi:catechol 2,3-dioxygenase-like lactoylglutathione lyase family enzyme
MPEERDSEGGAACRRRQAIAAFNRAWDLIVSPERTAGDDDEMLAAAFASRYLWDAEGGDEQRAVGDWQVAHVASLLGNAELALARARRALERVEQNGWTDWRLASCYEGMARAESVAGNGAEADRWAGLAREVLGTLDDEDERELIGSQLASIPDLAPAPPARSAAGGPDMAAVRDADRRAPASAEATAANGVPRAYRLVRLDHVQVAMPAELEADAEAFYGGLLGLEVLEKPPVLAARGGRWFGNADLQVHLGVEPGFRPALKAHPALVVEGLDGLVEALGAAGHPVEWDSEVEGVRRCYLADPFGNRIELIES